MKPVFKCDYCDKIGPEDEIREHEPICMANYDRKSCHTCVHKKLKVKDKECIYMCKLDKEIPEGKFFEFCDSYERKYRSGDPLSDLMHDMFG